MKRIEGLIIEAVSIPNLGMKVSNKEKLDEGNVKHVNGWTNFKESETVNGFITNKYMEDVLLDIKKNERVTVINAEFFDDGMGFADLEITNVIKGIEDFRHDRNNKVNGMNASEILTKAHTEGLTSIDIEIIEINQEKGYAIFCATVSGNGKGPFKDFAWASKDEQTIKSNPKLNYIVMAATRARNRALKLFIGGDTNERDVREGEKA